MTTLVYEGPEEGILTFDKGTRTFATEASTAFGHTYPPEEVTITVAASGNSKTFKRGRLPCRDRDNDIQYWLYKADGGFALQVFND